VTINQRLNGGTWNKLGTWTFDAGSNGYARIRTTGTDGHVIADAVKWVLVAAPAAAPDAAPRGDSLARPTASVWTNWVATRDDKAILLTDGDTNTVWHAPAAANNWQVLIDLQAPLYLHDAGVLFDGAAWTNMAMIGSADAAAWFDLGLAVEWPVMCRYLLYSFWSDAAAATNASPAVREVFWDADDSR